jgi:hypothetical protein
MGGIEAAAHNRERICWMLIKAALISAAFGIATAVALFALNLMIGLVEPAHYSRVVVDAAANGTLNEEHRWLLGPRDRTMARFSNNDCLIASMLASPSESRVKTAISPREPIWAPRASADPSPGFPNAPFCADLAALVLEKGDVSFGYYHRYLHGDRTAAAMLLAILPIGTAMQAMRIACYALLATVALIALMRRSGWRDDALLIIAGTFALFYGLPLFGLSFSFAPADCVLFGFLLFASTHPLGQLSEGALVAAVAVFASATAAFEFLTGGIPVGATLLMTLIAIGQSGEPRTLARRTLIAAVSFGGAIGAAFAAKLLALWAVWGTPALADFFYALINHIGGELSSRVPPALADWLAARGIDAALVDTSYPARVLLVGVMLTYSAFFIGWGSHLLGGALVLLPLPYLWYRAIRALRPHGAWVTRLEVQFAAIGLIPVGWYLMLTNHTAVHSSFMVRPLAINVALAAIVLFVIPAGPRPVAPIIMK